MKTNEWHSRAFGLIGWGSRTEGRTTYIKTTGPVGVGPNRTGKISVAHASWRETEGKTCGGSGSDEIIHSMYLPSLGECKQACGHSIGAVSTRPAFVSAFLGF